MTSPGAPLRSAPSADAGPSPRSPDTDECPLCGEPITFNLELTEDGPSWLGHCADCNTVVEAML